MILKILMCFLSIVKKNHHNLSNTMIKMGLQNEMGLQNNTITYNETYRIERFLELIKNKKLREEEEIRWDNGEVEW